MNSHFFYLLFGFFFFALSEGSHILRRKRSSLKHWGYTSQNGPDTWEGICQTGKRQSPINIKLGSIIVTDYPPFFFDEDYLTRQRFYAKNNGHTLYAALENDSAKAVVHGGGLHERFIFEQLHFHWESEHEVEGKRADLEMHLVHYNSKYRSMKEAAANPDGIAVFAVLFDKSNETNNVVEDFMSYILDAASVGDHPIHPPSEILENSLQTNEKRENRAAFSLRELLPKHVSRFFRYEGSLTTPTCDEIVKWTVFINRLPVSKRVLDSLKTLRDHDNNPIVENFRPPQKLNGRNVYVQMVNYDGLRSDHGSNNGCSNTNALLSVFLLCFCLVANFRF